MGLLRCKSLPQVKGTCWHGIAREMKGLGHGEQNKMQNQGNGCHYLCQTLAHVLTHLSLPSVSACLAFVFLLTSSWMHVKAQETRVSKPTCLPCYVVLPGCVIPPLSNSPLRKSSSWHTGTSNPRYIFML